MDTRDGWVDFNSDSDSSDSEVTQIPNVPPTDRHFSPLEKNFLEGKVKTAAEIKTVFQDTLRDTGLDSQSQALISNLMNIAFPGQEGDNLAQMMSKLAHITLKKVQEPNGKSAEEQGQEILAELIASQEQ